MMFGFIIIFSFNQSVKNFEPLKQMHRITIMNSKGGCGKTTIATNLAAYYASNGNSTCLIDHDPQGSSMNWLNRRSENSPVIHGINAKHKDITSVNCQELQPPVGTQVTIIDSPAGIGLDIVTLRKLLENTDTLLLPVLPSPIDIHACAHFIETLLIQGGAKEIGVKLGDIGIVANRVKSNTVSYQSLHKFLDRLGIPFVASLNDAQNYVFANENGLGIHELSKSRNVKDYGQWVKILSWLDRKAMEKRNKAK
ncbi:MAG: ParA family protein [Cocleimonas sp.]